MLKFISTIRSVIQKGKIIAVVLRTMEFFANELEKEFPTSSAK